MNQGETIKPHPYYNVKAISHHVEDVTLSILELFLKKLIYNRIWHSLRKMGPGE